MIDVVTPENLAEWRTEIEAMHRLRYRVFSERLNWEVEAQDGLERDKFDDLGPVYLLARDSTQELRGTWRLLPTTGPYMLRDVFPELLEGQPAPNDPRIWETSRFAVDGGFDGSAGLHALSRVTRELFCGLVEFCVSRGIVEVLTAYDVRIARLLKRVGCRPKWQSAGHRIGGTISVAGRFDTNEAVLAELWDAGGITHSVLRRDPRSASRQAA